LRWLAIARGRALRRVNILSVRVYGLPSCHQSLLLVKTMFLIFSLIYLENSSRTKWLRNLKRPPALSLRYFLRRSFAITVYVSSVLESHVTIAMKS